MFLPRRGVLIVTDENGIQVDPPHMAIRAATAGTIAGVIAWIVILLFVYVMFKLGGQ